MVVNPVQKIGDSVEHIYGDHNQEADHMADWGAKAVTKVTVESLTNSEKLNSTRGYWDGSTKSNGSNGGGIVVGAADRRNF